MQARFRYRDDSQVPHFEEARESLVIATVLYTAVLQRLPQSCHP